MILRYMLGYRGEDLTNGALDTVNCIRCTPDEIEAYIKELLPEGKTGLPHATDGNVQKAILEPNPTSLSIGDSLDVTLKYDCNDNTLPVFGTRIHYDSAMLEYVSANLLHPDGLFADSVSHRDEIGDTLDSLQSQTGCKIIFGDQPIKILLIAFSGHLLVHNLSETNPLLFILLSNNIITHYYKKVSIYFIN